MKATGSAGASRGVRSSAQSAAIDPGEAGAASNGGGIDPDGWGKWLRGLRTGRTAPDAKEIAEEVSYALDGVAYGPTNIAMETWKPACQAEGPRA
jgi:hypothetical protein